jgi:hypothetical protein
MHLNFLTIQSIIRDLVNNNIYKKIKLFGIQSDRINIMFYEGYFFNTILES